VIRRESSRHRAQIGAVMETNPSTQDDRQAEDASESRLLAGLRAADPAAWEEFVRTFGGRMHAVARRFLPSDEDCADAVQEAFVSALQAIGNFEGKSTLGTWLHRIVVNACLMKLRKHPRISEASIDALLPQFDQSGHHVKSIRRWKRSPDERMVRDETRTLVRECIDRLPDDYRTVILLRDVEEFSTDETASILGTAPGTVKTRLHRARLALRTLLEPHFT